jgi:hypothetical protein
MTSEKLTSEQVNNLMVNEQILTELEANAIKAVYPFFAKEYLFYDVYSKTYLNLYTYSEIEHDRLQLLQEQGLR